MRMHFISALPSCEASFYFVDLGRFLDLGVSRPIQYHPLYLESIMKVSM